MFALVLKSDDDDDDDACDSGSGLIVSSTCLVFVYFNIWLFGVSNGIIIPQNKRTNSGVMCFIILFY